MQAWRASSAHRLSSASSCPPIVLRVGTHPPMNNATQTTIALRIRAIE
jgi:hypothetical protein